MITPLPVPQPFAMFFENNYLSQPHKHSGARTEQDLLKLAEEHWESPGYRSQRQLFEAQADKQLARYESMGVTPAPPIPLKAERGEKFHDDGDDVDRERSDVEMEGAPPAGEAGRFKSINA